jgi:hypothetical protein
METRINMEEISASYQTVGNIYTTEIKGLGEDRMEQTSQSFLSDARVVDAVRLLEYYMEDQLVARGDQSSGTVEMSIIYFHEKGRANAGTFVGILTFGIGMLLGIPYSTTITDVEVEASFYDEQQMQIATHRGVGRGNKVQSLYNSDNRIANQKAIKKALEEINRDIMSDTVLREIRSPITP